MKQRVAFIASSHYKSLHTPLAPIQPQYSPKISLDFKKVVEKILDCLLRKLSLHSHRSRVISEPKRTLVGVYKIFPVMNGVMFVIFRLTQPQTGRLLKTCIKV